MRAQVHVLQGVLPVCVHRYMCVQVCASRVCIYMCARVWFPTDVVSAAQAWEEPMIQQSDYSWEVSVTSPSWHE